MTNLYDEFVSRERFWEEQRRLRYPWLEDDGWWLLCELQRPKGAMRRSWGQALIRLGCYLSNLGYRVSTGAGTPDAEVDWRQVVGAHHRGA